MNRKGVYMTSFSNRGYNVISALHGLPPVFQRFALDHVRKRTFLGVLNRRFDTRVYSKISMDATAF